MLFVCFFVKRLKIIKSQQAECNVALDLGIEIHLSPAQNTTVSHQPNSDITLHPRIEIYLHLQVQLNLNLQARRLGPLARRPVQDARLPHGRDAPAFDFGLLRLLLAQGHDLLLQGFVLLLQALVLGGGGGLVAVGLLGRLLLEFLVLLRFAAAGGLLFVVGGHVGFRVCSG